MPKREANANGPYIRWLDYGSYEGWKPDSYDTIEELLKDQETVYGNSYVITKSVKLKIEDITEC